MVLRRAAVASLAIASLFFPAAANADQWACDTDITAAAIATVDAACPCAGRPDGAGGTTPWGKHRHYKRCVRKAIRDLVRTSHRTLRRRCFRNVVRCSNKSTCGTDGAMTCTALRTGDCTGGICSNNGKACVVADDCTVGGCHIAPIAAACPDGALGTGSCCDPAPLDP
jgi:hypothetical protein